MRNKEQGILTVEASIVLTFATMFILFLLSFIGVYRAENLVSHGVMQAADAIALESFLRERADPENTEGVRELINNLSSDEVIPDDSFQSLFAESISIPYLARDKFAHAISGSDEDADELLRDYGVKGGIVGMKFDASRLDEQRENIIVSVAYTVKLQFPIFGVKELSLTKSAKAKTFGETLMNIEVVPENAFAGSTGGSGSYPVGTKVQISAKPNHGYRFDGWSDGSSANPRTITADRPQKYIARFKKDGYGLTIQTKEVDGTILTGVGKTKGSGTYNYLDTAVLEAEDDDEHGYHFAYWNKQNGQGKSAYNITSNTISQIIDQTYFYEAIYKRNQYTISVKADPETYGAVKVQSGEKVGTTIEVTYGDTYNLIAEPNPQYKLDGWTSEDVLVDAVTTIAVPTRHLDGTPIKNYDPITYTAHFSRAYYTVIFDPKGGELERLKDGVWNRSTDKASFEEKAGSTIDIYNIVSAPIKPGHFFLGWEIESSKKIIQAPTKPFLLEKYITPEGYEILDNNSIPVNADITLVARWDDTGCNHEAVRCGVTHYFEHARGSNHDPDIETPQKSHDSDHTKRKKGPYEFDGDNDLGTHYQQCFVCKNCGAFLKYESDSSRPLDNEGKGYPYHDYKYNISLQGYCFNYDSGGECAWKWAGTDSEDYKVPATDFGLYVHGRNTKSDTRDETQKRVKNGETIEGKKYD